MMSEAWRSLVSGTTRATLRAFALTALVGLMAVADARASVTVITGAADFIAAGASVRVIEDPSIDPVRCGNLAGVGDIRAAGAIRSGGTLRALNLPSTDLAVWEVTPSFPQVLEHTTEASSSGEGAWVSSDLATTLGVVPGGTIETAEGPVRVAGVYAWPDDRRARTLAFSILLPVAPIGDFEQCWAEVWPASDSGDLLMTVTREATQSQVGYLNSSQGTSYDAQRLMDERLTKNLPLAAAACGAILGWVSVRRRRLEFASALHARVPRTALAWQVLIETVSWVAASLVIMGVGVLVAATLGNPDPASATWLQGMRTVFAGSMAAILGALAAIALVRESHVFRYFKDR